MIMLQDVQMQHDLTASVAQVLGERQCFHKWAAMPLEGDSMLNLDYLKCLNTAQLLELLEDEERMRETVRHNSKVLFNTKLRVHGHERQKIKTKTEIIWLQKLLRKVSSEKMSGSICLQISKCLNTFIVSLYMTYLIWRTCLQLQHLQRRKKILMASNCWLAEQNLAHQPHLNNSKKLLAEKYQILGQMMSSVRRKQRKLGKFLVGL